MEKKIQKGEMAERIKVGGERKKRERGGVCGSGDISNLEMVYYCIRRIIFNIDVTGLSPKTDCKIVYSTRYLRGKQMDRVILASRSI